MSASMLPLWKFAKGSFISTIRLIRHDNGTFRKHSSNFSGIVWMGHMVYPSFENPLPHWGIPGAFTFTVNEIQWEPRLGEENFRVNSPAFWTSIHSSKHDSLNRLQFFLTTRAFTQFFIYHLSQAYLLFPPRVKTPPNPRLAPALSSVRIPRIPGNLNQVKTRWKPPVCPGYPQ